MVGATRLEVLLPSHLCIAEQDCTTLSPFFLRDSWQRKHTGNTEEYKDP